MLKLFLSTSFAVLTRKKGIFVTLLRKDVQRGTAAYMKESNGSKTYILLLAEIGWGTVLEIERLVSPIEMYKHVTISLVTPMTLSDLLW